MENNKNKLALDCENCVQKIGNIVLTKVLDMYNVPPCILVAKNAHLALACLAKDGFEHGPTLAINHHGAKNDASEIRAVNHRLLSLDAPSELLFNIIVIFFVREASLGYIMEYLMWEGWKLWPFSVHKPIDLTHQVARSHNKDWFSTRFPGDFGYGIDGGDFERLHISEIPRSVDDNGGFASDLDPCLWLLQVANHTSD